MEFTEPQWQELRRHAVERDLLFLSSPFSIEALEMLQRVGVSAWKVASGEVSNLPLLDRMLETGLPMLLSSGMSPLSELDAAVDRVKHRGNPLVVLQCTSAYPCPPEQTGLQLIPEFAQRYDCAIGLSDHSGTVYPGLAAATLGIGVLEVHVTLSREMFGPDVAASVTSAELRQLVDGVRFIERMLFAAPNKDVLARETASLRSAFTKSVVARMDLAAGTRLDDAHLAMKKAGGGGVPVLRMSEVVGRRLRRDVRADEVVLDSDVEQPPAASKLRSVTCQ